MVLLIKFFTGPSLFPDTALNYLFLIQYHYSLLMTKVFFHRLFCADNFCDKTKEYN